MHVCSTYQSSVHPCSRVNHLSTRLIHARFCSFLLGVRQQRCSSVLCPGFQQLQSERMRDLALPSPPALGASHSLLPLMRWLLRPCVLRQQVGIFAFQLCLVPAGAAGSERTALHDSCPGVPGSHCWRTMDRRGACRGAEENFRLVPNQSGYQKLPKETAAWSRCLRLFCEND